MPRFPTSPKRLLDKSWRGGHPFGRRLSRPRRWGIFFLFLLLIGFITFYFWITNPDRVRNMAQSYLSSLLGGRIQVGRASLSIFQGLKLQDVQLWVRWPSDSPSPKPDFKLFYADALSVDYNPAALLAGRIEASRIVATGPRVYLAEDRRTGNWSYEELRLRPRVPTASPSDRPMTLPEILLRNARFEYLQYDGASTTQMGNFTIEGQLARTSASGVYPFSLQTRGQSQSAGPAVVGSVDTNTGLAHAALTNFVFGSDVKAMLPAQVLLWCEDHHLDGRLDADVSYQFKSGPTAMPGTFIAAITLRDAIIQVAPEEWLGKSQVQRLGWARDAAQSLAAAAAITGSADDFWSPQRVDQLAGSMIPTPITLQHAAGKVTFTNKSIALAIDAARVEDNTFRINGTVGGYAANSPLHLTLSTAPGHDLHIPPDPHYVSSMPGEIREIYDRFRPQGHCRFNFTLDRRDANSPLLADGQVELVDGLGIFENFTYPVTLTGGKLFVSADPATGAETLTVSHVTGHGIPGGPNQNADLDVDGFMSPIGPEAEVKITIRGQNVHAEPALLAAFPRGTQEALAFFDAPGKGAFPTFDGSFETRVHRDHARASHWTIDTDVHVADASAVPAVFPVLLDHATGDLLFRGDSVSIQNGRFRRGPGSATIAGSVNWGPTPDGRHHVRPDLNLNATAVPLDADLIAAFPEDRRVWLDGLALSGSVDLDGKITAPSDNRSSVGLNLNVALHDVATHPADASTALTGLSGHLNLTDTALTITDLAGHRGEADVSAAGRVDWSSEPPLLNIKFGAKNLTLDPDLRKQLPTPAQRAWDSVKPQGSVDVTADFDGPASDVWHSTTAPTTAPASPDSHYTVSIVPRHLSVTPQPVPYKLDSLSGAATIHDGAVRLENIKGKHGPAVVSLDGTSLTPDTWDFAIHLSNAPVDADLLTAAPGMISDLLRSTSFTGSLSADINKLHITPHVEPAPATLPAPTTRLYAVDFEGHPVNLPTPPPPPPSVDINYDLAVHSDDASLDIGVPMQKVNGGIALVGLVVAGKTQQLDGSLDVAAAQIASRSITKLKATISKAPSQDIIRFGDMQALLAGGQLAGEVEFQIPDTGSPRYGLALVLRDADVHQITGEQAKDVQGRLTASLSLQGDTNNINSRQGRGEISVVGQRMYRMPLVLGLLQVTNLALPLSAPFTQGTARYSIQGMQLVFDDIELRSKDFVMQGTGNIQYDTHQVRMTFFTDNANAPQIPFIGPLIQSARRELLQVHVRGTLQDPQVTAAVGSTFTTTIDQVFRGGSSTQPVNDRPSAKPKRYGY